jgi:O-antigen/teichoic acid export membrane protein
MLRFGGIATLNGLVVHIAYNIEKLLLGRFLGAETLGLYGRAYQLISIPSDNLNAAISGVAFSALSRLQHDPIRQTTYFLKGYSLIVTIIVPIMLACMLFAEEIVLLVLGSKWQASAPIFRLLAPTIITFTLVNPLGWYLYATGRASRSLKIALVGAPLVIMAYCIGLPFGVQGVALAYSTMMILWLIPHIAWCIHGTKISAKAILTAIGKPLVAGLMAVITLVGLQYCFSSPMLSGWLRLLLGSSIMLVVYAWCLLVVLGQKEFYLGFLHSLLKRPA